MCDKGRKESEGETFEDKKHFHKLMKRGPGGGGGRGQRPRKEVEKKRKNEKKL